MKIEAESDTVV